MPKNKHLLALNELGQSIWYDNCSRDVLNSGELASYIAAGVSGLTSNPSIFKAAIAGSSDYDAAIKELSAQALGTEKVCEELMVRDVQAASDLLNEIYQSTDAGDGFASIEVSPFLASDTGQTIEAAKALWAKLDRANGMIKIPATKAGIPAIQAVLEAGINVNATLIFSVQAYEGVANAYISALETRMAKGQDIKGIASVASFFVSRVDSICEKTFTKLLGGGSVKEGDQTVFLGKVGIANSKLAYEKYEELFGGERFKKLAEKGARVQRPLWASTGTKNPAFSPILYVEELAGKDTVNTLPPKTLKTLMEHATVEPRLHAGLAEAKDTISGINSLGLPFDALLVQLEEEGVKAFADAYQQLLDALEGKCNCL
ncbi:transaldolase [Oligoflexia bacterium]|nr:transaldolase [Oligoflexia bacterium]